MTLHKAQSVNPRPSLLWRALAIVAALVSITLVAVAVATQRQADEPIGEGQLFQSEAQVASRLLEGTIGNGMTADEAVRHVRNRFTVEAVSIVDPGGTFVTSTSDSLVGAPMESGFLKFGHFDRRFVALAAPIDHPLEVDGVMEWDVGDVVYTALQPLDDGTSLLLSYDVSELFERRARAAGVRPLTIQLLVVAVFSFLLAAGLAIGRSRSARRYEQIELEADFLRTRSKDLERHNVKLDAALELSEETNRVRAEFVLMINHELRTPLTGVVTGAELLASSLDGMSTDDRDRLLEDMVTDGRRLQEMIGQMLTLARIENRGLNFDLTNTRASEVCSELEMKHPRLRMEHVEGVDLSDTILRTDVATLAQVVGSLADNALTHGANDVWLECTDSLPFEAMHTVGRRPPKAMYLLIHDDGPGIDPEFLPRAFEKFEKLSRSSGTGLGLYLVSVMVAALGTSLAVTTGSGGTTMAIAVPRVLAASMARVES